MSTFASSPLMTDVVSQQYDIINASFSNKIRECVSNHHNNVEVETRFTIYSYDPFNQDKRKAKTFTGLDQRTFTRLVNYYDYLLFRETQQKAPITKTREDIMTLKNYISLRKTIEYRYRVQDGQYVMDADGRYVVDSYQYYNKKTLLSRVDRPNYNVRLSIAIEETVEPSTITSFKSTLTRNKQRRSYTIANKYRLDLTEVTQVTTKGTESTRYEVELELLPPYNLTKGWDLNYERQIKSIIATILDTRLVYTVPEYKEIVKYFNTTMFTSYLQSFEYRKSIHNISQPKLRKLKKLSQWANPRELDPRQIYKPRNLHFKDMVFGGLVGNANTAYTITYKADGKHKIFVVYNYHIWLLQPRTEVALVYYLPMKLRNQKPQISKYFDMINGCIIEGEMIPQDKRRNDAPKEYYFFLAFDCLASENGGVDIQGNPLVIIDGDNDSTQSRLNKLAFLTDKIQSINDATDKFIKFVKKDFNPFYSVGDFYSVFRRLDDQEKYTPYETDGYIFTPIAMQYNSGHADLPLQKRILTNYADICKWKPAQRTFVLNDVEVVKNMWTIDLMFLQTTSGYGLYTTKPVFLKDKRGRCRKKNEPILFQGTSKFPYQQNTQTIDQTSLLGIYNEGVGEFEWVATDEQGKGYLRMVRIRHDKMGKPNRHDFAEDTWELARNPIKKETMRGDDIKLMRRYHNRIKFTLFNQALNQITCKRSKHNKSYTKNNRSCTKHNGSCTKDEVTFLDIGSGRGGDSSKLAKYSRGVFVEPYQPHLSELQRRTQIIFGNVSIVDANNWKQGVLDAQKRGDRVIILHTGGENTTLITNVVNNFISNKVDVVSMMLSLSFFWKDTQMYERLIETILNNIKPDGQFIYLTIDGDIVQQAFIPAFADGLTADSWLNNGDSAKIHFNANVNSIDISLPGTIVGDQTESLVRLNDISASMRSHMISDTRYRADQELFLSTTGKTLSTLYTYGRFVGIGV